MQNAFQRSRILQCQYCRYLNSHKPRALATSFPAPKTFTSNFSCTQKSNFSSSIFHNQLIFTFRHGNFSLYRSISTSKVLFEDSKVNQTVDFLKDKEKEEKGEVESKSGEKPENSVAVKSQEKPKVTVYQKIKNELLHYYTGFKLFFIEVRISTRLLRKITQGDSLSRREKKQLLRTVADIFRLVPFSIFIIVPFMEFLLPFAIKLFPNMLPSTFQDSSSKEVEKKLKQRFKVKLEMTKFLQDTVEEMALKSSSHTSETAQRFSEFIADVQKGDVELSNDEIIKFSKAFRDSLMLDNLDRRQLSAICKILSITPIGPTNVLVFQIKLRMRKIRADDELIHQEGHIHSLEISDLQNLVRERGMRAYGVSKERLVAQLEEWLDLHLDDKVPLSLLLLSRTLYIPDAAHPAEALKATISKLPKETSETAKLRLGEMEGATDNVARLEKVKREEQAIRAEAAERAAQQERLKEKAARDKVKEQERLLEDALHDRAPGYEEVLVQEPPPASRVPPPSPEVSQEMIRVLEEALTDVAEAKSNVSEERDDLSELVMEVQEYNQSLQQAQALAADEASASAQPKQAKKKKLGVQRGSKLLSRYLQYSLRQLQPNLEAIEKERSQAQQKIEQLVKDKEEALDESSISKIDTKIKTHEGTLASTEEVVSAIKALSSVPDDRFLEEITKIIDPDKDGIVDVDGVVKAMEFLSSYGDQELSTNEMKELIEVLSREKDLKRRESAPEKISSSAAG